MPRPMPLKFFVGLAPLRLFSTAIKRQIYDVVIVGGGMVGYGLAAAFAASKILHHKNVLLLEHSPKSTYLMQEQYDTRTVAINEASRTFLTELGAWEFIESKRLQPVNKMKVWESCSDSFLTFERDPLAHIIENNLLTESLRQSIKHHSQADDHLTVLHNAKAFAVTLPSSTRPDHLATVQVQLDGEPELQTVETSLLIGADGWSSKVREMSGIQTVSWDHGQSAVVATMRMGQGHEEFTAWQRFTSTGPIALLPLSSEYSCLIWSTTNAEADRLMSLPEDGFVGELNHALLSPSVPTSKPAEILATLGQSLFRLLDSALAQPGPTSAHEAQPMAPRVEGLQTGTKRSRYPLGFVHANFYHSLRVALCGDAAHRILPLAGQGVNLGFGDVICLIDQLEQAASHGADLGSAAYLKEYTTTRQRAVIPVAAVMEALNLLYSNDALTSKLCNVPGYTGATEKYPILYAATRLVAGLRAAGVQSVQSSALIKNFLIDAAVTGQLGATKGSTL